MANTSDEKQLLRARVMIDNLPKNAELAAALQALGMNIPATQAEGERLREAARLAIREQDQQTAKAKKGWDDLHAKHDAAWAVFQIQRDQVSSDIVERRDLRQLLELDAWYAKGRPQELAQMQRFYEQLLPNAEAQALLTSTKVAPERLEEASDTVIALSHMHAHVIHLEAEKHQATERQEKALEVLREWCSKVRRRVDIAAEENPGLADQIDWDMF